MRVFVSAGPTRDESLPVFDLEAPAPVARTAFAGARQTPQQQLYWYSPAEWELFIREWATGLSQNYVQIKGIGGSGDGGADVAAFKTPQGFEGAWDCFQGKHYADPLVPSDAWPEILKVFKHVAAGDYVLPDSYSFLAPQGVGSTLNRLLSKPSELKAKFLEQLRGDGPVARALSESDKARVLALVNDVDFSIFRSVELADALAVHKMTPFHVARFGGALIPRDPFDAPPGDIAANEARYVEQLIGVYAEKHPDAAFDAQSLSQHPIVGEHFQRQRFAFYSAEALRVYARDAVPPGTFDALQDDVHAGVIETAEAECPSGMERLTRVLQQATQLDLTSHTLITVSNLTDRKGMCHRLANEDRLRWLPGAR
jgi:hypothetical protein